MRRGVLARLDERGLRVVLAAFFVALAVPSVVLVAQAFSQLKWGAFRSVQVATEELAARIDASLRAAVAAEDARAFGDYSFLVVAGDAAANFVQRSPLSMFPAAGPVPGVLGYFQIDAAGGLTTPLLPEPGVAAASYGIAAEEAAARAARVAELRSVLAQNRLVRDARDDAAAEPPRAQREQDAVASSPFSASRESTAGNLARAADERRPAAAPSALPAAAAPVEPAPAAAVQAAFDRLEAGVATADERQKRVEQSLVPEPVAAAAAGAPDPELAVRTFASEVDPFAVGVLDTGHFVLFRNVWRDGQRYIQGALIEPAAFLAAVVAEPYRASSVAGTSRLTVTFRGRPLDTVAAAAGSYGAAAPELAGTLLHRARLSPPFGDFELAFAVGTLPRAPGTALVAWVAVALAAVLCVGFLLMYRFAAGQLKLARQQQDFVSAVSHELKTPLTSIRMYGEMLKAGWADDAKKSVYYDYIHSESERLSRLIENVLQLARLTRNTQRFDTKRTAVAELLDMIRSKVAVQVERAGFTLEVRNDVPAEVAVAVDADCFAQIFINLVDNALKFSVGAATKTVAIAGRRESDGGVLFTVRDFGPGVPKAQMKKIFELFYRPQGELTRETAGTGIGLALVRQLATAMGARIDVRNCEPGAEFRLRFPPGAARQ